MISGFVCECHGFVSDVESGLKSYLTFLAGTARDGWFTNDDLVVQTTAVFPLFEKLHPNCDLLFGYNNSMNHHKRAPDGLGADRLPLKDGGKNALKMHNTWYMRNGIRHVQLMQNNLG